jgi:hypothetical protein
MARKYTIRYVRQYATDEIRKMWIELRDKRDLHKDLDRILDCPYDDLKLSTATTLEAMLELRSKRDAEAMDRKKINAPPAAR